MRLAALTDAIVARTGYGHLAAPIKRLGACLSRAGWEVDYLDIDLTGARFLLEFRAMRGDGYFVQAQIDQLGRCTMDRFHRTRGLRMDDSMRGRRPLSPMVDDVFMGRSKPADARALLGELADHLSVNGRGSVLASEVRAAFERCLVSSAQLDLPSPLPCPVGLPAA